MGAKTNANGHRQAMNGTLDLISAHKRENLRAAETREAHPRYAEFIFVSYMNILNRDLKVIHNLGDE